MKLLLNPTSIITLLHAAIVVIIAVRVVMKRPSTGVALAWLFLVAAVPFGGAFLYVLFGERRVTGTRAKRIAELRPGFEELAQLAVHAGMTDVDWSQHRPCAEAMARLGQRLTGAPTVRGTDLDLISDTQEILKAIAVDIDEAEQSVLMEFYIWHAGGAADRVLEALKRAARRGVVCRLLVDEIGAKAWWRTAQPRALRDAGVKVRHALPVGLFRTFIGRNDLRLHRKIVVIDSQIGYTGSMNLVDPRYFKQDAGVGEWVDAMVRVRGSAVAALAATQIGDWNLETGEPLADLIRSAHLELTEPEGTEDVQVVPSGPMETDDGLIQMLLATVHAARRELIVTTPYFVPDEAMLRALRAASARGVDVKLIVPKKVDSFLVRHASRSYYDELMDVGVEVYLYRGGLLHTKAICADDEISMFGTANLDMRSLWLNYEVSLFVYGTDFGSDLRALLFSYLDDCEKVDPVAWNERPFARQLLENAIRLFSPLL